MSIAFYRQKGKTWLALYGNDVARYFRGPLFGLLAGVPLGFWIGFLVTPGHVPFEDITLRELPVCITAVPTADYASLGAPKNSPTGQKEGSVVASANGTRYYFPWCSGVSRIREENKIWFQTEQDAQNAGYTKATSCQ